MSYTGSRLLVDSGPTLDQRSIERPRLIDMLLESFEHGLAAIVAPSGFGKTTLIAQFAEALTIPVANISIREGDEDATWLSARISAAVGAATSIALEEWIEPESLAHWLNSAGSEPFALLIDDVHTLADDSPGARLLDSLLGSLRSQYFLLVSSRREPSWPGFRRRRQEGSIALLRTEDLKFSKEEVERAIEGANGDPQTAAELLDLTGGWALALSLSLSHGGRLDLLDRDNLEDSFEREFLEPLSAEGRRTLSLAGCLSRLTPVTSRAGGTPGSSCEGRMETAGLTNSTACSANTCCGEPRSTTGMNWLTCN
jgi:ATP/maltotriose-dependent transcriptional regulator MalT